MCADHLSRYIAVRASSVNRLHIERCHSISALTRLPFDTMISSFTPAQSAWDLRSSATRLINRSNLVQKRLRVPQWGCALVAAPAATRLVTAFHDHSRPAVVAVFPVISVSSTHASPVATCFCTSSPLSSGVLVFLSVVRIGVSRDH